jgi:hypothetical protein
VALGVALGAERGWGLRWGLWWGRGGRGGGRWVADKAEREGKEWSPGACSTWSSAGLGVDLGVALGAEGGWGLWRGLWWGLGGRGGSQGGGESTGPVGRTPRELARSGRGGFDPQPELGARGASTKE